MDKLSIRGLMESGGRGTVVAEFKGTLDSYSEPDENRRVAFNFADIEVIHSDEVYPFDTITLEIKYSNRKSSSWGVLAKSLAGLIPSTEDLSDQVGRVLRMKWTEGHDLGFEDRNAEDWEGKDTGAKRPNVVISAWEVVEVEGVIGDSGESWSEVLESLLNNKTKAQFNKDALSHPVAKIAEAKAAITSGSFVKEAVDSGKFTVDTNKIYHAVAQ